MNAEMRVPSAENAKLSKVRSEYSLACFAICQEFYCTPFCPLWGIVNAEIGFPSAEKADISKVSRSEYSLACFATCQEFYLTPFCRQWGMINAEIGSPLLRIQRYRRLEGQNIDLRASLSPRNSAVLLFYRHWDIINAEIRVNAAENTELSMVRRSEYGLAFFTIYQEFYRTPVKSGVSGTLKLWSLLLKIQSYRQLQGQNIALHASPSARNSTVLFSARSGVPVKLKLWSLLL